MHFVLIHWKIRRTEQAVHDFLQYWSEVLTIPDRTGLIGEFLSQPLRPEETGLFQNGVALQDTPAYYSFINLGLWEDVRAFQEQIDRPYRQRGLAQLPFEYAKCQGLLLHPCQWRLGTASLPAWDQLGTAEGHGDAHT
jgi:hypothetical protein